MKIEDMGEETGGLVWQYAGLSSHVTAKSVKQGLTRPQTLSSPPMSPVSFILLYSDLIYSFPFYVLVFPHFSSGVSSVMLFTLSSTVPHLILSILCSHKVTYSSHHLRQATVCLDKKLLH